MSKSEEYIKKIRRLKNTGLKKLFKKVLKKNTPGWPSGKALEYLILRQFELEGAEVIWPFDVKSIETNEIVEQIDGIIYYKNLSCIIECKDYKKEKVDFTPLAKMRNQLLRRPSSTIGSVFTTSSFTEPAIILATYTGQQAILLWEKTEIEYVINNQCICKSLIRKYKKFNELCLPDYNTKIDKI